MGAKYSRCWLLFAATVMATGVTGAKGSCLMEAFHLAAWALAAGAWCVVLGFGFCSHRRGDGVF